MDTEHIIIAAAVLFVLSALFMRNTHPYSGSREEKFESKMVRRRIGIFLLVLAMALVGIAILTLMLISRG
jgi:uncharacterized membrane protein